MEARSRSEQKVRTGGGALKGDDIICDVGNLESGNKVEAIGLNLPKLTSKFSSHLLIWKVIASPDEWLPGKTGIRSRLFYDR
jgi:hypothetical protein